MNTVYVLWIREIKKYFRSKSRIIGALGQPILFLIAFGYGFQSIFKKAGGGNYIEFLAPGIILMSVLFTGVFSGINLIWDREFGFLKETMAAPVSRFSIILGKTLGGATVALMQGIIVFLLTLIIGFKITHYWLLPIAFIFVFLVSLLFTSLGTTIASMLEDMQGFQLIINFLVMPIFFLSGALFPLTGLPKALKIVARIDPLTYGIDGLRHALIAIHSFSYIVDFLVLFILTIIILGIGTYVFERIQV
jgi:ABC-2 type transport system permease protein